MFAGAHEAAQKAAMFYSFFATCKLNGIEHGCFLSGFVSAGKQVIFLPNASGRIAFSMEIIVDEIV
ncbi:MAG: hypothetical protein AAF600_09530, partial [Bacteroidota bacterium]